MTKAAPKSRHPRRRSAPPHPSTPAAVKGGMRPTRLLRAIYKEARDLRALSQQTGCPVPPPGTPWLPTAENSKCELPTKPSLRGASAAMCRAIGHVQTQAHVIDAFGGKVDDDTLC